MSEQKAFKIKKTVPGNVLFVLHPASNPAVSKEVYLTDRNPYQVLPFDWAMGIFLDDGIFKLYEKGAFTFEDNEAAVKAAYESGNYFGDSLDFTPAKVNNEEIILTIIKSGNRASIEKAIKDYGREMMIKVAAANVNDLNTGIVRMLESMLKVQLTIDNDTEEVGA